MFINFVDIKFELQGLFIYLTISVIRRIDAIWLETRFNQAQGSCQAMSLYVMEKIPCSKKLGKMPPKNNKILCGLEEI